MKLSERKKQLGVTLSLVTIEDLGKITRNYLGQMWTDGKCERVEAIMLKAQARFDSAKFNYRAMA